MYCTGDEDSLFRCDRSIFTVASGSCTNHYYDLGLKCERKQVHKIKVTIRFHYHQLFVKKEPFTLKTAHHQLVVVWKYVPIKLRAPSAVTFGTIKMPVLSVDNWDSLLMVCRHKIYSQLPTLYSNKVVTTL